MRYIYLTIAQYGDPCRPTYRIHYNGSPLGDDRGFGSRALALEEARRRVARRGDAVPAYQLDEVQQ